MDSLPPLMKGVVLTGHGGPEKLVWREDLPLPQPKAGEALIRVHAAGMNNTDINTRLGWYAEEVSGATGEGVALDEESSGGWAGALPFPLVQGGDLCGTVAALGAGVEADWLGKRVTAPLVMPRPTAENPFGMECIGSERDGAFAQFCALPVADLYDVGASPLSDIEIAAIPCAFGTAAALLSRAGVAKGKRVLITGASGGVGMAAVQLAHLQGAHVTGLTSASKAEAVRAAGATEILLREETPPRDAFDCVADVVGGAGFGTLIDALRPGGTYAVSGAIAGPMVEMDLRKIYLKDLNLAGSTYQPPETFAALIDLVISGRLRPLVSNTYPLQEIHAAQADFQSKRYPGKLVLIPPQEFPA